MLISEEEKRNTAYHESGHCLVAKMIPETDPVHKITIIPRGHALGVTVLLPEDDRHTMTREDAEGVIAYAMGGRAAEMVVFNQYTTGAGNDIEKATSIAKKMVCNWGMSEILGPISFSGNEQEVFLGRELNTHESFSNSVLEKIDSEVNRLVTTGYERAVKILEENRTILDNMAEALLIRESLGSAELNELMTGNSIISDAERVEYETRLKQAEEEVTAKPEDKEEAKVEEEKKVDGPLTPPMPQEG